MKDCPICGAMAFDDARLCYGCLHDFTQDDGGKAVRADAVGRPSVEGEAGEANRAGIECGHAPGAALPERGEDCGRATFLLSLAAAPAPDGALEWTCTVEPCGAQALKT